MIFLSKPIHKGIERFKTNKFSGCRDVTSKFSWVKQGKNHRYTRPTHGWGKALDSIFVQVKGENQKPTETIQTLDERKV